MLNGVYDNMNIQLNTATFQNSSLTGNATYTATGTNTIISESLTGPLTVLSGTTTLTGATTGTFAVNSGAVLSVGGASGELLAASSSGSGTAVTVAYLSPLSGNATLNPGGAAAD